MQCTEPAPDEGRLPPPTMLSVIAALVLAEMEVEHPGIIERITARLSDSALRATIVRLRGERATPAIIRAQEEALLWLTTLGPALRVERRKRRKS